MLVWGINVLGLGHWGTHNVDMNQLICGIHSQNVQLSLVEMSPEHLEHLNISKSAGEHDETVAADALGDKYSSDGYYSCLEMSS